MRRRGSPASGQREVDDVEPGEDAVDDRPENRVMDAPGDRDREGAAEADATLYNLLRAIDDLLSDRLTFVNGAGHFLCGLEAWCVHRIIRVKQPYMNRTCCP